MILPARDAGATVDRAIDSVLRQTLRDFVLLAIDDGSTDDTLAHLRAWAGRDVRVRVLQTGGVGLVGALNLGLEAVETPYFARMDADDESLPRRFEVSLASLEQQPRWAGVGTGVDITRGDRPVSPNLQRYGRWLSSLTSPELVFRERFIESPLCHPSTLLKTDVVRAAGGWREGPFPEDWELWLRLLERGEQLSVVPEVLHRWTDHDRRLTRTDARYALHNHLALKADYLSRLHARVTLWGATDTGRTLSRQLSARGVTVERFVELNPRKLGQRIHGVPVVPPDAVQPGAGHVLSCVAAAGARDEIRAWFSARGFVELRDFTCVA